MTCPSCGGSTDPGAKFCPDCGTALGISCPSCGQLTAGARRFCSECGTELRPGSPAANGRGAAGAATGSPTLGAPPATDAGGGPARAPQLGPAVTERRLCSVLFVDLVSFTTISEKKDPEEVRELLSSYFEMARTVIGRYGGVVEKFIGDAVMAVWGTPVAREGDTERAVRAAIEVVDAVGLLGEELGAPGLRARGGVVTGEVAVNVGQEQEGMVVGDSVNTASRVQSVATGGAVLVDETTKRLSEQAIAFSDEGSHALKGKEAPEHLYKVIRVISGVGGNQRSDGLESPLVGRDAELRALKDLFHTAVERRTPRLVVVSGPPGVGKSRLSWELEKYIDGLADAVLWHRGRCLSYGEGVSFWALAEIVRQRFGIAEEDRVTTGSEKLHEGLVRFVTDQDERDYVGLRLARLLGLSYGDDTRLALSKEDLFSGWRIFFERLAGVAPVMLLVEDAQHADKDLLGFFEHLVEWTRDLPIVVVLFARPGLQAIDSGYGTGKNRSSLSLDPLGGSSIREMVSALVPDMPEGPKDTIVTRAAGIPLFAIETVRSLVDKGIVAKDDGGGYHLVGEIGEIGVPDSLHQLLASRLDALSGPVRSLVQDASVLGSTFPKEALLAVSGGEEPAVDGGLRELLKRDVFEVFSDPLSPERGSYRFTQEMLREVAYETLSRRDRKSRHLAVAAHLRSAFPKDGEEISEVIARHYLDAFEAAPEDGDAAEIKEDALSFLVRAAERSKRSGAPARAASSFADAAGIAPPAEVGALLEQAAEMYLTYGDYEQAMSAAGSAEENYRDLGNLRRAARARWHRAWALLVSGHFGEARPEIEAALEVLRQEEDADTVRALSSLSRLEALSGNLLLGERFASEALSLAQGLDLGPEHLSPAFSGKGMVASIDNRQTEALVYFETAVRLAEETGNLERLAAAQANLADGLLRTDAKRAVEVARAGAWNARLVGNLGTLNTSLSNLALALLDTGAWDEAAKVLDSAIEEGVDVDGYVMCVRGWLAGLRGDAGLAEELAATVLRDSEDLQVKASFAALDAFILIGRDQLSAALCKSVEASELGVELGIRHEAVRIAWPLAARTARHLGDKEALAKLLGVLDAHRAGHLPPGLRAARLLVRAVEGETASAEDRVAAVGDAVSSLRAVGNPYELAHGLVDYAEALRDAGLSDQADASLAEVREIAARLSCPPLLRRADELSGSWTDAAAPAG